MILEKLKEVISVLREEAQASRDYIQDGRDHDDDEILAADCSAAAMFATAQELEKILPDDSKVGTCAYCGSENTIVGGDTWHDSDGYVCYDLFCDDCDRTTIEKYEPVYVKSVKGEMDNE